MAEHNPNVMTTTSLRTEQANYSVDSRNTESTREEGDLRVTYPDFSKWYGYYRSVGHLKKPVDALALWTVGKGYQTNLRTDVRLSNITGMGEDSFTSILFNLFVVKKINGDAFAEIIRDDKDNIINLKPLDPTKITTVVGSNGIIKHYLMQGRKDPIPTHKMFHVINERIADECRGCSVVEVCENTILALEEAKSDYKKLLHRNIVPVRIIEIDSDQPEHITKVKNQYQDAIKNGEVLVVPKGNVEIKETVQTVQDPIAWINMLEDQFYVQLGVPRVLLGGTPGGSEANSKMSHFAFQEVWQAEQKQFEDDIRLQLGIQLSFSGNASIQGQVQSSEAANTGQIGLQPKDTQLNLARGE